MDECLRCDKSLPGRICRLHVTDGYNATLSDPGVIRNSLTKNALTTGKVTQGMLVFPPRGA